MRARAQSLYIVSTRIGGREGGGERDQALCEYTYAYAYANVYAYVDVCVCMYVC